MTVLILAREIEPQVDRVVEELAARDVPVFRTNLAAFPQRLTLDARLEPDGWNGTLATERRAVRLRDIRSIWYRHPAHFELPEGMSRPEQRYAAAARIDFRADYSSLDYSVVEPPPDVRDGMLAFLRAFDLSFGAFDFAVTTSGEWIMFECNPFGQYGWLEDTLNLPITSALADLLEAGVRT